MKKEITILYVDDEDINLFLFERAFKTTFRVVTAKSGEEALVKLEKHSEDHVMVISDMRMPGMDGLEFISTAKNKYKNVACYILSAFIINNDISNAVENKLIDRYFTKPFDFTMIRTEVEKVANRIIL